MDFILATQLFEFPKIIDKIQGELFCCFFSMACCWPKPVAILITIIITNTITKMHRRHIQMWWLICKSTKQKQCSDVRAADENYAHLRTTLTNRVVGCKFGLFASRSIYCSGLLGCYWLTNWILYQISHHRPETNDETPPQCQMVISLVYSIMRLSTSSATSCYWQRRDCSTVLKKLDRRQN